MSGGDDETAQVMTSLGARLRAIRQARGLTLAQLAAATGARGPTGCRWTNSSAPGPATPGSTRGPSPGTGRRGCR